MGAIDVIDTMIGSWRASVPVMGKMPLMFKLVLRSEGSFTASQAEAMQFGTWTWGKDNLGTWLRLQVQLVHDAPSEAVYSVFQVSLDALTLCLRQSSEDKERIGGLEPMPLKYSRVRKQD